MTSRKLPDNEIVLYQTPDGGVKVEVLYSGANLWLTQRRMAELFDCSADNISLHLKNLYDEGELERSATTEEFSVVQQEGRRDVTRTLTSYSLEAVIAVGYTTRVVAWPCRGDIVSSLISTFTSSALRKRKSRSME